MTQRRIKWLAIGLIIPMIGILTTSKARSESPRSALKGLHWSTVDYAGWRAHDVTVSFNKVVKIGWIENIKSLSTESAQAHSVDSHTPNLLASRIKSVEIDNLIIHHDDEDSYNTRLGGTVYPTIALTNDWLSVGRTEDTWLVSGTVDSTSDDFARSPLNDWLPNKSTAKLVMSASITDLSEPIDGEMQNIEVTHPLLGTTVRIPGLQIFQYRRAITDGPVPQPTQRRKVKWIGEQIPHQSIPHRQTGRSITPSLFKT